MNQEKGESGNGRIRKRALVRVASPWQGVRRPAGEPQTHRFTDQHAKNYRFGRPCQHESDTVPGGVFFPACLSGGFGGDGSGPVGQWLAVEERDRVRFAATGLAMGHRESGSEAGAGWDRSLVVLALSNRAIIGS